ncbi:putative glycosyl transferase [Pelagibacter phage HTVC112P]|nr:putative glycosyl transferase [Pelagibacter phage HTVC112P]
MLDTYVVEGGVGKCVAFTSLIPKLRKKSEIQIYTPYIDCFAGNPDVKLALESTLPLQDPRIMASNNIYYSEPYKSNFQFGKQHLIESYCELHNVEFDKSMKPKIYTDRHKDSVKEWLDKNKIKKYILIQLSGGQSKWNYADNVQYQNINPNRNYQPFLAQQLVNMLLEEYKDTTIINCVLPNEPHYQGTIRCDLHWSQIHEMLKGSEGFVCIDSCLNHFSASAEKHGVVIWGSTRWTQFGYSHNKNLQFHMTDKWIEEKFIDNDPRNNMVEPKLIIDEFKKLDTNKPVALATE